MKQQSKKFPTDKKIKNNKATKKVSKEKYYLKFQ